MLDELPKTHPDHPDNFRKAGEFILGKVPIYNPPRPPPEPEPKKEEVSNDDR